MKTYLTLSQLAPKLGFHGKAARVAAYKWVIRRSIPKRNRGQGGRPIWLVAEEDVQASLDGASFVRSHLKSVS